MNEKQLKELIQLVGHLGLIHLAKKMLAGGDKDQDLDENKPTGLARFMPWLRGRNRDEDEQREKTPNSAQQPSHQENATNRVDAIIRSVMPDWKPENEGDGRQPASHATSNAGAAQPESGNSKQFGQLPQSRVDAIIRSVMPDWKPPSESDSAQPSQQALQSIITGAVEKQDNVHSGQTPPVQQPEVPGVPASKPSSEKTVSRTQNAMDAFQLVLDGIGVIDPTPITDGTNAAISLGRAFITDPERRKEHLQNAAISAAGMIPYVGDTAKLAKIPRAAKTVKRMGQTVRGVDRAADGAKVMTAAEKRAARSSYRQTAEQVSTAAISDNESSTTQDSSVPQAAGGGSSQPPNNTTPIMTPSPDPGSNGGRQARTDEEEGVEEYYSWRDSIKDSAKKLADFGGALGKGALKIIGFVEGLRLLNTGVLALNRDLAAYNGEIASAYARSDAADIRRDMSKAGALSGPLSGLADEQTQLKDAIASLTRPLQAIGIGLLEKTTALVNIAIRMSGAVDAAAMTLETIAFMFGYNPKGSDTAWRTFFQDVSDGKFDGKRPSFLNPKTQILDDADHLQVFGPP